MQRIKKVSMVLHGKFITKLRSITCHMGSHSVTCHLTEADASGGSCLNLSQKGRYLINLSQREG